MVASASSAARPLIREARAADLPAIAAYLAPRLGGAGGARRYQRFLEYAWMADKPNLGFLIEDGGRIGGFIGAIYARRYVGGREILFCNLTSWHVDDEHRNLSLALVGRLLARRNCTFTTFSPSERVVELLKFLKFRVLDPEKVVFTPAAGLSGLLRRPTPRIWWGDAVRPRLTAQERQIFQDHRPYRCGHFVIERGGDRCYVVTIRRGRGAKAFADVLHASNPELLADAVAIAHVPIGLTHRTCLIGIDRRLLRSRPAGTFAYRRLRPAMFRSDVLEPIDVDTLYSELVPMYG